MNLQITPRVQPADHYLLGIGVSIFYLAGLCGEARRGTARLTVCLAGVCLLRGLTAVITQASEQTHLPPPNSVVHHGRRGVQGRDVVVQRKVRFCCFFAGNRLARESGGTCTRWMVLAVGGAVTRWPGCASPTPLMIGLHLTVPTLHGRHSCWEARKLTPPATNLPLRVAFLDALPLNLLLITGCGELKA